jgi:lactate dehydrogenase-like 2-hydroxyacid dehydrogenase
LEPRGYVTRFALWVDDRALFECEDELRQLIADSLEAQQVVEVGLEPMTREPNQAPDHGWLKIVTPTMINPAEALAMKQSVTAFLLSAIEQTQELVKADEAAAAELRAALGQPDDS